MLTEISSVFIDLVTHILILLMTFNTHCLQLSLGNISNYTLFLNSFHLIPKIIWWFDEMAHETLGSWKPKKWSVKAQAIDFSCFHFLTYSIIAIMFNLYGYNYIVVDNGNSFCN